MKQFNKNRRPMLVLFIAAMLLFTSCGSKPFSTAGWAPYEIKDTAITANMPCEPVFDKNTMGMNIIQSRAVTKDFSVQFEIYEGMFQMVINEKNIITKMTPLESRTYNYIGNGEIIDTTDGGEQFFQNVYTSDTGYKVNVVRCIKDGGDMVCVLIGFNDEWNDTNKAAVDKYFKTIKYGTKV